MLKCFFNNRDIKMKLDEKESKSLYERLKKADEAKALSNILRKTDSYISFIDLLDIFEKLKDGKSFEINNSIHYLIVKGLESWETLESLPSEDITLTIKGFNELKEAEEFCSWYSGQGEQDASIWFDCRAAEGLISTTFMGEESTNKVNKNNIEMFLKMHK